MRSAEKDRFLKYQEVYDSGAKDEMSLFQKAKGGSSTPSSVGQKTITTKRAKNGESSLSDKKRAAMSKKAREAKGETVNA